MNLVIRKAVLEDIDQLVEFNQRAFPLRQFTREFIQYRFEKNEKQEPRAIFYIAEFNEEIVAQRVMLREDWWLNGNQHEAYWGTDFFVHPAFQGKGIGKKIINEIQKDLTILSTTNTGAINLKMHQNLNYYPIGQLNLYFKPLKIFSVFNAAFKMFFKQKIEKPSKVKFLSFPEKFNEFKKRNLNEINFDFLKFESTVDALMGQRDENYLKWRFFHQEGIYQFYQNSHNSNYFIGRSIVWKGMNCLMIVDMRYDLKDTLSMRKMLKTINELANKMSFAGILISSSHIAMQKQLLKQMFFNYSKNQITTNFPKNKDVEILVHFADSDLDYNYSNSLFVYGEKR